MHIPFIYTIIHNDMRWLLSFLVLALLGLVQAFSSSGNRLLVVIEEVAEKAKYSTFWGDLEGLSTTQCTLLHIIQLASLTL